MMKRELYEAKFDNIKNESDILKKNESKARKAKRYGIVKRINVEFTNYDDSKKEHKVKMQNISRTGVLIFSRYYLEDELIIKISENIKLNSKIVRRGILEDKNMYFYGVMYNDPLSPSTFNSMINGELCYDYERCCRAEININYWDRL